jgi:hypothetical protein
MQEDKGTGEGSEDIRLGASRQEMVIPGREEWLSLVPWIWRQYW